MTAAFDIGSRDGQPQAPVFGYDNLTSSSRRKERSGTATHPRRGGFSRVGLLAEGERLLRKLEGVAGLRRIRRSRRGSSRGPLEGVAARPAGRSSRRWRVLRRFTFARHQSHDSVHPDRECGRPSGLVCPARRDFGRGISARPAKKGLERVGLRIRRLLSRSAQPGWSVGTAVMCPNDSSPRPP